MDTQNYNVKELLEDIGYRLKRVGTNYMTRALYRGGDNTTALSIHHQTGGWHDFVTGESGTLKDLIERTTGKTFEGEIKISSDIDVNKFNSQKVKVFDPELLDDLLPVYDYWNNRGISDDTLRHFKNGLAHKNEMYQRSVFPIINPDGKIYGMAGRSILPERQPKWKIIGKKTSFIYPTNFNKKYVTNSDHVILVESIGCVLGLWEAGIKNTICLFGLTPSSKMVCHLLSLNKRIVIATNNDDDKEKNRGKIAAEKIKKTLLKYFDEDGIHIFLPFKGDFNDQSTIENLEWHKKMLLTIQ